MKLKFMLLLTGLILTMSTTAQKRPLPSAYVDSKDAAERIANFREKSDSIFSRLGIRTNDSIFLPINSFNEMIKYFDSVHKFEGIRIVFVQLPNTVSSPVWKNQLSILFSPIETKASPVYYYIPDGGRFSGKDNQVPDKEAATWVSNYATNMLPALEKTIYLDDPENRIPNVSNVLPSDTKYMSYCRKMIEEFADEIRYQDSLHPKSDPIDGIKFYFSAYGDTGILLADGKKKYRKRLMIQMAFTKKGSNFEIDTTGRDPKTNLCPIEKMHSAFVNKYDNGQLCPANCP